MTLPPRRPRIVKNPFSPFVLLGRNQQTLNVEFLAQADELTQEWAVTRGFGEYEAAGELWERHSIREQNRNSRQSADKT